MQHVRTVFVALMVTAAAFAQDGGAAPAPQIGFVTGGIDAAAQSANLDLQRVRIEKWKTDGGTKQEQIHNLQSLQRSLTGTLPEQSQAARANGDVASMFRLYRTLSATFDVLREVAESAGAFGQKGEYEQLAGDLNQLGQARSRLGDAIDAAAHQQTAQLMALRNAQAQQSQGGQQAAAGPPKKIIVDNEALPAKKTVHKKKPAAAAAPATSPK